MNLAGELASEIWTEQSFHDDLANLEAANIRAELQAGGLIDKSVTIDIDMMRRLVQIALVFSETDDERYQEVAQRISTATLRLAGSAAADLFAVIQGRLRNFPALGTARRPVTAPANAPLSLQYEFAGRRLSHTVIAGDASEHVLTPFQLRSWKLLAKGRSGALSGPTSAGKSYVLLLHMVEQFRSGALKTAAYVVPTRALINQVSDDATAALAERGVNNVSITSIPVDLSSEYEGQLLYVVTQERLDALLISNPKIQLDLVDKL